MSSPPDFLGLALGMIRQQQDKRAQAQQSVLEQQRFDAQQHRLDEAEKQDALKLGSELIAQGFPAKAVFGIVGDKLPESYRPFLQEAAKRKKEEMDAAAGTPSEAGQADIATGAAASAAGQTDPRAAAMSILRALPATTGEGGQLPPNISNQLAARAGGIAAENQRQGAEFESRQKFATGQNLKQFYAQQGYGNSRDTVSIFVPPNAVKPGLQPGFNTIVGRDKANAIIAGSNGLIREVPLSLSGATPEAVGLTTPAATKTKLYDDLGFIADQRRDLQRVGDLYDPRFLEYFGQAGASISKFKQKFGLPTTEDERQFSAEYKVFKGKLGNTLMGKIQQRAATTFTDRLFDRMKEWNLNDDMSDAEFKAMYKEITQETDLNYARTIYALKHDPVVAQEAEDRGEIPMPTRNKLESRYSNERVQKMIRTTEQRAVAAAIRSGASDEEAAQAGRYAVEQEYFTPPQAAGSP